MSSLRNRWSGTGFWNLVETRADETPESPMLVDTYGRTRTFGEYRVSAERTSAALARIGVAPGVVVSWQMPTSIEAFVLMGALARLGAVQNPILPVLREREVAFIVSEVRPAFLLVPTIWRDFDYEDMARTTTVGSSTEVIACTRDAVTGRIALPESDDEPPPPASAAPGGDAVRWVYYSSGTTADPKGIRHTDASVMYAATGLLDGLSLGPDDCYPIAFPVTHIGGMAVLTAQLVSGCRLGCVDVFDVSTSPQFMARIGATLLGSALPFLRAYVDEQRAAGSEPLYPDLRACLNGGAPKPVELHYEVKRVLGGVGIASGWGLTEFPIATQASISDDDDALARTEGRPVAGVEVRVVDPEGTTLPLGEEGELLLRGPQMFQGYVDARLDREAFAADGWFRTGDLGVVERTGHVRITGRLKDVIIRNAENVSGEEVAEVLLGHEQVGDVTVIGIPDARRGERICAVVVGRRGGTPPTLEELRAFASGCGLARHKLPDQLEIVSEIPRNSMGKVLKQELRARFADAG